MSRFGESPLYPILDADTVRKSSVDAPVLLAMWQDLGVRWVQIRDKSAPDESVLASARSWKKQFPSIELILNDRWHLAAGHRDLFAGLHLGQEDLLGLDLHATRELTQSGLLLGISTHRLSEAEKAVASSDLPWSYVAVGPCYPTVSKPGGKDPVLSSEQIVQLTTAVLGRPGPVIVWIGGMNQGRVSELRDLLAPRGLWKKGRCVVSLISAAMDRGELLRIRKECELTDMASPSHGT